MANRHELEIEINTKGEIQVKVKGAKGKKCLDYVQLFNTMGEVKDQEKTGEYYEPEPGVFITDKTQNRFGG